MTRPSVDLSFACGWQAKILSTRPLILPPRHFVYPRDAEEVERGALEVLVQPPSETDTDRDVQGTQPFLATCALGFRDPSVPTGVWSTPEPEKICAVSGGYAYLIDTTAPERFTMIEYRPVMAVLPAVDAGLLLFVGHHSILAWGSEGQRWHAPKLSDEGVTVTSTEGLVLHGMGWEMMSDRETPFALDLRTGMVLR